MLDSDEINSSSLLSVKDHKSNASSTIISDTNEDSKINSLSDSFGDALTIPPSDDENELISASQSVIMSSDHESSATSIYSAKSQKIGFNIVKPTITSSIQRLTPKIKKDRASGLLASTPSFDPSTPVGCWRGSSSNQLLDDESPITAPSETKRSKPVTDSYFETPTAKTSTPYCSLLISDARNKDNLSINKSPPLYLTTTNTTESLNVSKNDFDNSEIRTKRRGRRLATIDSSEDETEESPIVHESEKRLKPRNRRVATIDSSSDESTEQSLTDESEKSLKPKGRTIQTIESSDDETQEVSIEEQASANSLILSVDDTNKVDDSPKLYNGKFKIKSKASNNSKLSMINDSNVSESGVNISNNSKLSVINDSNVPEPGVNISNLSSASTKSVNVSRLSESEIITKLKQNKMILKTTNINLLPDKGSKIFSKIKDLEEALEDMKLHQDDLCSSNNISSASSNNSITEVQFNKENIYPSKVSKSPEVTILSEFESPNDRQLKSLRLQLREKQMMFRASNIRALPDGGLKLQEQITDLQKKLLNLEATLNVDASLRPLVKNAEVIVVEDNSPPKYRQTKLIEHGIQISGTTGTKQTNAPSNHHIPQHILEAMYGSDKNFADREYGGKLSASREQDMRKVTSGAIKTLHDTLKSIPDVETEEEEQPQGIRVSLMPHQRKALKWLLWREAQNPPGGILADDMGLGKTLTMLCLILKHKELVKAGIIPEDFESLGARAESDGSDDDEWLSKDTNKKKKSKVTPTQGTLVVCPASLLGQWEGEAKKHVKGSKLSTFIYHGTSRALSIKRLTQYDLVITTYQIVMREAFSKSIKGKGPNQDQLPDIDAQLQGKLFQIGWTRIVLDEAHQVKNHKSQTSKGVAMLRGGRRWAVTGTPVQNKEMDLFSMIRFLRVEPFGNYTCWKHTVQNNSANGLIKLNLLVKTLMLRRSKDQIDQTTGKALVELPPKEIVQHSLYLSQEERQVYDRVFAFSKSSLAQYMKSQEEKDYEKSQGGYKKGHAPTSQYDKYMPTIQTENILKIEELKAHHMLVLLLRLRQICCHPSLIRGIIEPEAANTENLTDPIPKEELEIDLITQMNEMSLHQGLEDQEVDDKVKEVILTAENPVFKKKYFSSKISKIISELEAIMAKEDIEKAVIVSQWSSMLEIVYKHLRKNGIKVTAITGQIPVKDRGAIVNEFNNDINGNQVLLLSLGAGGVGLNLVGANHLFLIDMHWNPQLEAQACDRIYRVGQTRPVTIHRFVVENTVEEKILALQQKKLKLADEVLTGAKRTSANTLSLQDMKSLFGIV